MKKKTSKVLLSLAMVLLLSFLLLLPASAQTIVPNNTINESGSYPLSQATITGLATSALYGFDFLSVTIAGHIAAVTKAVYCEVDHPSTYTAYFTFKTTKSTNTDYIFSSLSKTTRGTGNTESATSHYVYKSGICLYYILVSSTLEAYKSNSEWYVSYPSITSPT